MRISSSSHAVIPEPEVESQKQSAQTNGVGSADNNVDIPENSSDPTNSDGPQLTDTPNQSLGTPQPPPHRPLDDPTAKAMLLNRFGLPHQGAVPQTRLEDNDPLDARDGGGYDAGGSDGSSGADDSGSSASASGSTDGSSGASNEGSSPATGETSNTGQANTSTTQSNNGTDNTQQQAASGLNQTPGPTRDSTGEPSAITTTDQKDLCDNCGGTIVNLPAVKVDATFGNPSLDLPSFGKSGTSSSPDVSMVPSGDSTQTGPSATSTYQGPADAPTNSKQSDLPATDPGDFGSPSETGSTGSSGGNRHPVFEGRRLA